MNAQEFLSLADLCLAGIAKWLEDFDPDEVDYNPGDGSLTIEFPDGARFILSRQAATTQLWVAAGASAWHYNWDASQRAWLDDKDGHELRFRLAEALSEKLGRTVEAPN